MKSRFNQPGTPVPEEGDDRRETIVAEISKDWPADELTPISVRFEQVIQVNARRGYRLRDWRMTSTCIPSPDLWQCGPRIVETILAVFELIPEMPELPINYSFPKAVR